MSGFLQKMFMAPTNWMGDATNRIWNSRIGDWVQDITPKPLRSMVHTGLNEATSGFFPGTIPGFSGTVADAQQQGRSTALRNDAGQGLALLGGWAGKGTTDLPGKLGYADWESLFNTGLDSVEGMFGTNLFGGNAKSGLDWSSLIKKGAGQMQSQGQDMQNQQSGTDPLLEALLRQAMQQGQPDQPLWTNA